MQQNVIFLILNVIGLILGFKWIKNQIQSYYNTPNKIDFFTVKRFQYVGILLLIVAIPLLLINFTNIEEISSTTVTNIRKNNMLYAFIVSGLVSLVWLKYILKLDIFNPEKKRYIALILLLSIVSTAFAHFWYDLFHAFGIVDAKEPIQSFLYSVFGIGLIEETVKFVPFLIVLKFTKAIDEPYDYILYASASALGFAFLENGMYLHSYGIDIINARAMYATVAHMTFSSVIAYGLFLIKYKKTKYPAIIIFATFYLLAITSHGFYDFWIMNEAVSEYDGITTLFFLATIHIWFLMKNNTINTSNYFTTNISLNNDTLKVYLMISLLSIFMFSYLFVAFLWNEEEANSFFIRSLFTYAYIIFYLIATLSRYNIIKGMIRPIRVGIDILFLNNKEK